MLAGDRIVGVGPRHTRQHQGVGDAVDRRLVDEAVVIQGGHIEAGVVQHQLCGAVDDVAQGQSVTGVAYRVEQDTVDCLALDPGSGDAVDLEVAIQAGSLDVEGHSSWAQPGQVDGFVGGVDPGVQVGIEHRVVGGPVRDSRHYDASLRRWSSA